MTFTRVTTVKGSTYILPSGKAAMVTNLSDGIVHLRYVDGEGGLWMRREVFEAIAKISDYIE